MASHHIGATIPKDSLELSVDESNDAAFIGDDHRVGSRFEQALELPLLALASGDVSHGGDDVGDDTIVVGDAVHQRRDRESGPVRVRAVQLAGPRDAIDDKRPKPGALIGWVFYRSE